MNEPLVIDEEFKTIIPPLTQEEYANLETSLRVEGCRDAIIAWNNTIVDGHNRYEICHKWNIPYSVIRLNFSSRPAAISWICLNQLSRRNLTKDAYKYLIGKRYDAEKTASFIRNKNGLNQFSCDDVKTNTKLKQIISGKTSRRLGNEYNITHTTVERYGEYSRSLDRIEKKMPGVLPSLLSGKYRISIENLSTLSKQPESEVNSILTLIQNAGSKQKSVSLSTTSAILNGEKEEPATEKTPRLNVKVKELPEYNPDAEINGIMFTIPTWIDVVKQLSGVPIRYASKNAKTRMMEAIDSLQEALSELRKEMEESI